jgi:hypothetical protein
VIPVFLKVRMKDAHEVLRLKEIELSRVTKEVEALRVAAPLLSEGWESADDHAASSHWPASGRPVQVPRAANADPQPEHANDEWKERTAGFP